MAISASAADTVLAAFEQARSNGAQVSFDPNLRLRLWPLQRARAMIRAALVLADYCFASLEDMQALLGERAHDEAIHWLHEAGARIVFLKLGPQGVIVSDGRMRTPIAGHPVAAVDPTGAGDCFCGAALARMAGGDDAVQGARYANAAVAPLPRPEAVVRLLRAAGSPIRHVAREHDGRCTARRSDGRRASQAALRSSASLYRPSDARPHIRQRCANTCCARSTFSGLPTQALSAA